MKTTPQDVCKTFYRLVAVDLSKKKNKLDAHPKELEQIPNWQHYAIMPL